jgi:hypothetical protein
MATKFTFPKAPKVGDRIEIVSISEGKFVGNSEAGKNLKLIFPGETKSGEANGETIIATITEKNTVYIFKCVTAQEVHTWLLEGMCLYPEIVALKARVEALETALGDLTGEVD